MRKCQLQLDYARFSFRPREESKCNSSEIRISADGSTISAAGFDIVFSSQIPSALIPDSDGKLILSAQGWDMVITQNKVVIETDWLGLTNIFFDDRHNRGGSDQSVFTDVSDFDPVGLDLYLRYGYCCLGRTPFAGIKQLFPGESLILNGGTLRLADREDPFYRYLDRGNSSVTEVLDLIRDWFRREYDKNDEGLIIPLTGGYDSRLLTALCRDVFPSRDIISPTFGVSAVQHWSYEVTTAKKISSLLNTNHQFVPLSTLNWSEKIDQWIKIRGFSSHAHGMHFIDFYDSIASSTDARLNISGIYGDLWAGNHNPNQSSTYENDYEGYFIPHQMSYYPRLRTDEARTLVQDKITRLVEGDSDDARRIMLLARNKIVLINYLFEIPSSQGFLTSSPFVDPEIVAAMLKLPSEIKKNRIWQTDFFRDVGLHVRSARGPIAKSNVFFARCCWDTSFEEVGDDLPIEYLPRERFGHQGVFEKISLMIMLVLEYLAAATKLSSITLQMNQFLKPVFRKMVRYYHLVPLKRQISWYKK